MQIAINIVHSFSLYILISLSFYLCYTISKFFNLAHAAIITLGAYFIYLFSYQLSLHIFVSIILSIISAIFVGISIEFIIYRKLRKLNISPFFMLIASLGIYVVLQNVISLTWGDEAKIIRSTNISVGNKLIGAYITDIQIITFTVSLFLLLGIIVFQKKTKLGRQI
ncbi:MAG: hypothetical protein K8R44_06405, partial [Sulfurimonas sp.]|nr:hypothetical protein [Sulfurimonas sp.]